MFGIASPCDICSPIPPVFRNSTDSTFNYRKDYTEDQLVRLQPHGWIFSGQPLELSNIGYLLVGMLVHRVTGRFYGDVLRDLIFAPVGMRTTRIISEADIIPNRAAGYQFVKGRVQNQDWVAPSLNTTADGSLYFTVDDLHPLGDCAEPWPGPHPRGPSSRPSCLQCGSIVRTLSLWVWLVSHRAKTAFQIGHTGSWQGFKTALYRYPEFNLTVIVLANLAQAEPGAMAEAIAGIVEPELQPPQMLREPLPGAKAEPASQVLLRSIAEKRDAALVTPGLHRFLSDAARRDLRQTLDPLKTWTELGCDDVAGREISWLGSPIDRVC